MSAPAINAPSAVQSRVATALRAIAFGAISRGTVSITSAWRAGTSKTNTQPVANDSGTSCHTATFPVAASQLSTSMTGTPASPTTTSNRFRLARSARVPAARPNRRFGSMRAARTNPTPNPPPPASSASHAVAVPWIPAAKYAATLEQYSHLNATEPNELKDCQHDTAPKLSA